MKKLSLLLGLFIFIVALCGSAGTSPQPEQAKSKTEKQAEVFFVAPEMPVNDITPLPVARKTLVESTALPELPEADARLETEPSPESIAQTALPQNRQTEQLTVESFEFTSPKMGDRRVVDGQVETWMLGFGWIPDSGPNIAIYAEDMYENGNKIGIMGDINKQVGIMD